VPVISNLDNLVYFAASAVALGRLGRRSSPLAEGRRNTLEAERGLTQVIVVIEVNGYRISNLRWTPSGTLQRLAVKLDYQTLCVRIEVTRQTRL
jgi:hypothetical protein